MVLIDLEVYDRVLREVMWWVLEQNEVPLKYVKLIKDMYDKIINSVRTRHHNWGSYYRFALMISINISMH